MMTICGRSWIFQTPSSSRSSRASACRTDHAVRDTGGMLLPLGGPMDRRTFLAATAVAAVHAARPLVGFTTTTELGSIDGSVSGYNFTAAQFLDYLSSIKLSWAMISLPVAVQDDEAAVRAIR